MLACALVVILVYHSIVQAKIQRRNSKHIFPSIGREMSGDCTKFAVFESSEWEEAVALHVEHDGDNFRVHRSTILR